MTYRYLFIVFLSPALSCDRTNKTEETIDPIGQVDQLNFKNNFRKQQSVIENNFLYKTSDLLKNISIDGSNPENSSRSLILVLKNSDCTSCLAKAEQFMNREDLDSINKILYVLGNRDFIENRINFENKAFDDSQLLFKELGYFHTPALLDYQNSSGISSVYLIPVFEDSVGLNRFRRKLFQ